MSTSTEVFERFVNKLTLVHSNLTADYLRNLFKQTETEIEVDKATKQQAVYNNIIRLEEIVDVKDSRLTNEFYIENVSYLGRTVPDILEQCEKLFRPEQFDYFGFSITTKQWYIGSGDVIVCYIYQDPKKLDSLVHREIYSYSDDEETEVHRRKYQFYNDAYNRLKKMDKGVVDIILK